MALTLAQRVADRADRRANPPERAAIAAWFESDCGHARGCPTCQGKGLCAECGRCASCAACRPEQRTPTGDWDGWLMLGGRGSGKTRPGAEDHCKFAHDVPFARQAIIAPTFADARDTCVEGESGIQSVLDRYGWTEGREYVWNRSLGEIRYLNGGKAKLFSAEKPARLRGPQHHRSWVDELAQVILVAPTSWDMMLFGLRLGRHPKWVATTTPLPLTVIKELVADPRVHLTRMRMEDNIANLAEVAVRTLYGKYKGTELGRQELDGDILDDLPGALWRRSQLDRDRLRDGLPDWVRTEAGLEIPFHLTRVVVAVDPAFGEDEGDETGIVVAGVGNDDHFYVLADYSCRVDPGDWVKFILGAYDAHGATEVVIEVNNGRKALGDLIRKQEEIDGRARRPVPIQMINAKMGKRVRAETPSMLSQQGRVHHVLGEHRWEIVAPLLKADEWVKLDEEFKALEDQLTTWVVSSKKSPDRLDAYAYALLHLSQSGPTELYSTKTHIPRHSATANTGSRYALHTANNFRR